jgi:hypothetical protein
VGAGRIGLGVRSGSFDCAQLSERFHDRIECGQGDVDDGPSKLIQRPDDLGHHGLGLLVECCHL